MSKGITLTFQSVLVALFVIGVASYILYQTWINFLQLHVIVSENEVERRTINIANVLLSYEDLVYIDDTINRGIFDAEKLDSLTKYLKNPNTPEYTNTLIEAVINSEEWRIGYPNSYIIFVVIDLESCVRGCSGWVGAFKGPFTIKAAYTSRFINCLADPNNIDLSVNTIFRTLTTGPITTLWQPWDLRKCWENTLYSFERGEKIENVFLYTSIPSISSGFPVLIRYPNGDLHIGRIFVGVWQWF